MISLANLEPAPASHRIEMNGSGSGADLRVTVDAATRNPDWDAFVGRTPGGHHAQSSHWGEVKAVLGWRAARLLAWDGATLVGGVQLLARSIGPHSRAGGIAFAPRGPLIAARDAAVLDVLLGALDDYGRDERLRYLKLQPPTDRIDLFAQLEARGWTPSTIEAAPTATIRVDLELDEEQLFGRLRKSTRGHVRQAERRGLVVREGSAADVDTYWRIVEATSRRQGFAPYPRRYYEAMWRTFGETGAARMLLAELDGRTLAATLLIGCGDSATYKMGGWSGERTNVNPSDALHWQGIRWARDAGYRFYDFDGVSTTLARAVQSGAELPESARRGVEYFKLGFGGQVEIFPGALDRSPVAMLRPAVRLAAPRLHRARSMAHRVLGRG